MIPLQNNCDPDKPEEHVLWALVRMNEKQGAPLLLPLPAMEEQSKHLYDCGFRHHPDLQTKHYVPPQTNSLWDGMDGTWADGPPPESNVQASVSQALAGMDEDTKAELLRQLKGDK